MIDEVRAVVKATVIFDMGFAARRAVVLLGSYDDLHPIAWLFEISPSDGIRKHRSEYLVTEGLINFSIKHSLRSGVNAEEVRPRGDGAGPRHNSNGTEDNDNGEGVKSDTNDQQTIKARF